MIALTKQVIYGGYGISSNPYNTGSSNSPYKVEIPPPMIEVNKSLQYEFRVLESTKDGGVVKVGLQVRIYEVDHFGVSLLRHDWTDVERVRLEI